MILFILGVIIYGLSRATQQASLFIARSNRQYPKWIDEGKEIHFFGWFEPIGLIIACTALSYKMFITNNTIYLLIWILGYFIYWLPYSFLYCYMRKKEWFSGMYQIYGFKTKLLSKEMTVLTFILSVGFILAYCGFWF
jgi:hypothetical protein